MTNAELVNAHNEGFNRSYAKAQAELENKIADIKANCDLAIEGRDVKIKELKQQIEKMKCCWNCKYGENKEGKEPCSSCNKNWGNKRLFKKITDKWELEE